MIVFHAADLLWATKIKSTAEALGIAARPVRSVEMLEARLGDSPVGALIVDLDAPETALALIRRLRAPVSSGDRGLEGIRIVAFGPHVAVDALRQAKAAGADTILTRGALHARLPEVLRALGAAGTPSSRGAADEIPDALED